MNKIYTVLSIFFFIGCLMSCQSEDELGSNATGYLRLGLEVNTSSNTRS